MFTKPHGTPAKTGVRFLCMVLLVLSGVILAASQSFALDGFAVTVRYELPEDKLGNIHDWNTPGTLMRYDVEDGKVVNATAIAPEAVGPCICPFGRRVAFLDAQEKLHVMNIDGTNRIELGKAGSPMWSAGDGGRFIYYMNNNALHRVNIETAGHERVVQFNASAGGSAISLDATKTSGKLVIRTDNYTSAIYDISKGDGNLYGVPRYAPSCGESISPDGSVYAANGGAHVDVALVDMNGRRQHAFRISQWDGDPIRGITRREEMDWAWQHFRWTNSTKWVGVTQGPLRVPSTHEVFRTDAMLYNYVDEVQFNLTKNENGQFDRLGGFWVAGISDNFLGYHSGEAPLTITFSDPRIQDAYSWDFGDGSPVVTGTQARHTFNQPGVFTVKATQHGTTYQAEVSILPRRAPAAVCRFINPTCLVVEFDEPARTRGNASVVLASGTRVQRWELNETGRRMIVHLDGSISKDDSMRIRGFFDFAQVPNEVEDKPLEIAVPPWPTDRSDVVFLWEDASKFNGAYDEVSQTVKTPSITVQRGNGAIDRAGRMSMRGGMFGTGFFAQAGERMDFGALARANAFTLEATIQPANLTQTKREFPARIVNCSAWHDGDWNFMLGQQADQLLFSIRTTDNFLNMQGEPTKNDLHGRAPVLEIFKFKNTDPNHVVISYVPGRLAAYINGEKVLETDEVTGNLKWGYGELVFGGNHNGGRYNWLGSMEGVAFYKRFMEAGEAKRNYDVYKAKIESRVVLPQIEVEAVLLATSNIPDPAKIAPYRDALVVNEYEVRRVIRTDEKWTFEPEIRQGMKIRVAEWGLVDAKPTELSKAETGKARDLLLEDYDSNSDRLDEVVRSDTLELDLDIPQLYAPNTLR